MGFPGGSVLKNLPANAGDTDLIWVWNIAWRRKWQPTPVFLTGKFHGERSLAVCSPWGHKGSNSSEQLSTESVWHPQGVLGPE